VKAWTPERRARQGEITRSQWTPERRVVARAAIRRWKPWEKTTGPRTPEGKARVSRNAYKGGAWRLLRELAKAMREQKKWIGV